MATNYTAIFQHMASKEHLSQQVVNLVVYLHTSRSFTHTHTDTDTHTHTHSHTHTQTQRQQKINIEKDNE